MKQEVCVGGFILNKVKKLLIVKRSDKDSFLPGMWELPGGGLDIAEVPQNGVQREIQEEVGLNVEVGKPLGVHTYVMRENTHEVFRIEITFLCLISGPEEVKLSFEQSKYKWIELSDIRHIELTPYMRQVINDSVSVL